MKPLLMVNRSRVFGSLLGAALIAAPAFAAINVDIQVEGNRYQATNGSTGVGILIVNLRDMTTGRPIDDVSATTVVDDTTVSTNGTSEMNPNTWYFKNAGGGQPVGATRLTINSSSVINLGDGEYLIQVMPTGGGGGIWRSGEYVCQVRVASVSPTVEGGQTINATYIAKIVVP